MASEDTAVRVMVLTSEGEKAFCSGADLKEGLGDIKLPSESLRKNYNPMVLAMRNSPKPIIGGLNGIAAGAGPVDDDGNAAAYMIFAVTHRLGTGKPVGSLQAFANAMAKSITESGAEIILNAPVAEIVIEDGAAKGVRLSDGRVLRAKVVIATSDPKTTFAMTTPGAVEAMRRLAREPVGS